MNLNDFNSNSLKTFKLQADPNESTCELPVKSCSLGSEIACTDKSGFFKVDNLFAELKTDYDKFVARTNLGIATEALLNWGNLKGSITNQEDLVKYLAEQIGLSEKSILGTVQSELAKLDAQSSITTIYYGPNLNNMTLSNSTTFTTGDYEGNIYIVSPNYPTHFYVNGLEGGFNYMDSIQKDGKTWYRYLSDNKGLGTTEITVKYG